MSERLYNDLAGYIRLWNGKSEAQIVEELSSWALETHRLPDPYSFQVRTDGKLLSPQTGELVEKSIERTSYLGQLEWIAFDSIQNWCRDNDTGTSFWVSPPHALRSEFTKVIISELSTEDNTKKVFNRSLMLKLDSDQASSLHEILSRRNQISYELLTSEQIRSKPVFLETLSIEDWTALFSISAEDEEIITRVKSGQDIKDKQTALQESGLIYGKMFVNGIAIGHDDERTKKAINNAKQRGFFGNYDSTCPTAFTAMLAGSESMTHFSCPRKTCGKPIPKGFGIETCPHCGYTKEQAAQDSGVNCD